MARASMEARAEAAELYKSGTRPEDVIARLGLKVHPSTVVRWAGGAPRPGPRGRTDLDGPGIVRMRDEERLSWDEIGRRLGAYRETIRRHYRLARAAEEGQ